MFKFSNAFSHSKPYQPSVDLRLQGANKTDCQNNVLIANPMKIALPIFANVQQRTMAELCFFLFFFTNIKVCNENKNRG